MSTDLSLMAGALGLFILLFWRLNRSKFKPKHNGKNKNLSTKRNVNLEQLKINHDEKWQSDNNTLPNVEEVDIPLPTDFLTFKLFTITNVEVAQQQAMVKIARSFRKPHPLLLPLLEGNFEPNELFDLIKTDPEITAKILTAVNSPLFSLRQPIANINHAIIFMGVAQVKNIAVQVAVQSEIEFNDKDQNAAYQRIWSASYLASAFCLLIAKKLREENAAELSTRCLLSYLGDQAMLAEQASFAVNYQPGRSFFERVRSSQEKLSVNSSLVGHCLAQNWSLPESLTKGIANISLPLTNSLPQLEEEQRRDNLICYIACRLGDLVAFEGVRDIAKVGKLDRKSIGGVEFYYLQENLTLLNLDKINIIFSDPLFIGKANKLISQVFS